MPKNKLVVISDLHVDTWSDQAVPNTRQTKLEHFLDFLDQVVKREAKTLVINGDLFDSPAGDGTDVRAGNILPTHQTLVDALLALIGLGGRAKGLLVRQGVDIPEKDAGTHHANYIVFNEQGDVEPGPEGNVRDWIV